MIASRPVTRCERLSLVDTCAVRRVRRSARAVASVSGAALRKFPPMAKNTCARPSAMARIAPTVSWPCRRGGSKPNVSRSLSRNAGLGRSQMPMVRSPCTLLCPRTGQVPAPRLPMLPRTRSRLTISWMLSTALRCCVSPMAHVKMMRRLDARSSASRRMSSRSMPLRATRSGHGAARTAAAHASNPSVLASMNARSMISGRVSAICSSVLATPMNSGTSPLMRTGSHRLASGVPLPSRSRTFWGWRKRTSPVSASGLTLTMRAPFVTARCSAVNMRGWFVPGFWPTTTMSSAASKSSSVTEPLPRPSVSPSADPLDSWHMLEQSGRLLVPSSRTNSW